MNLLEVLAQWQNAAIMVAASAIIATARKSLPEFFKKNWVIRLEPVLPFVICEAAVWLPDLRADEGTGSTVMLGLVLGAFSSATYKIYKQTVRGKDSRVHKEGEL